MLIRQAKFVDSVKFLQSMHQKDYGSQARSAPVAISGTNHQGGGQEKLKTPSAKSDGRLRPIGKILNGVLTPEHAGICEKRFAESKPNKPEAVDQNAEEDRIVKLEQQLEHLGRQIEKIARTLNVGLASE